MPIKPAAPDKMAPMAKAIAAWADNNSQAMTNTTAPTTIATNAVEEYFVPLRYGDTLTATNHISAISDEKTTRLGVGHFYTSVDTYRNQLGQVVGTHSFTLFTYRPHPTGDSA